MNKIEIIGVGDLKFKGLKELEQDYVKKIKYFTKISTRNIRDIKSPNDELKKKKEGELMANLLTSQDFVFALDEYGKQMNSVKFSSLLETKLNTHPHRIVFLIGGHAGLSPTLDKHINQKISFSQMTFPHDLFRVLFLEQLYRAFTIIKKIKYHR